METSAAVLAIRPFVEALTWQPQKTGSKWMTFENLLHASALRQSYSLDLRARSCSVALLFQNCCMFLKGLCNLWYFTTVPSVRYLIDGGLWGQSSVLYSNSSTQPRDLFPLMWTLTQRCFHSLKQAMPPPPCVTRSLFWALTDAKWRGTENECAWVSEREDSSRARNTTLSRVPVKEGIIAHGLGVLMACSRDVSHTKLPMHRTEQGWEVVGYEVVGCWIHLVPIALPPSTPRTQPGASIL